MIKLLIFAKNRDGGTGTFIKNMGKFGKKDGLDVYSLVLNIPQHRKRALNQRMVSFGGKDTYDYSFSLPRLLDFCRQCMWFKKQIDQFKPDVVLVVDAHCLIIAHCIIYLFFPRIVLIPTIHNNIRAVIQHKIPPLLQGVVKNMIGWSLQKAKTVVCVSEELSKDVQLYFKLKKTPLTIYSGIDNNIVERRKKRKNIVISIGRFSPQKDFFTLIKAYSLAKKKIADLELWMIGDGPQKRELMRFTKTLSAPGVKFIGWTDNPLKYLKRADLFAFSSNWEGCPYVLIEALSQGLPVIATNTPFGPSEILERGKYGVLIKRGDYKAMARALCLVLTDNQKYDYYARRSQERASFFSHENTLYKYKKIISQSI